MHCNRSITPSFTLALCPILGSPANGQVTVTGNLPGDTATYSCDPGFELSGERVLTCGNDVMWSADPPTCIRKLIFSTGLVLLAIREYFHIMDWIFHGFFPIFVY